MLLFDISPFVLNTKKVEKFHVSDGLPILNQGTITMCLKIIQHLMSMNNLVFKRLHIF